MALTPEVMRSIGSNLLFILAFGVAGYAVYAYGVLPRGSLVHPDMKANFLTLPAAIYTLAFASAVALALGPFQFSANLPRRRTKVFRWLGRVYRGGVVARAGNAERYAQMRNAA